jgi:3-oxoacyl-[acyl-carrier-protein] synthase III
VTAIRSVVLGCGAYLPQQILTNAELAGRIDTSDEWIVQRTGIRQRHIAGKGEFTSHLAIHAARAALANAGADAQSIDLIVLATSTPDNTFPATAVTVQNELGIHHGAAFDLQAVCSGFVFALATADNFLRTRAFKRALVIGAETFSRILDWSDRGTAVLFGDGAGAVVLMADSKPGVMATALRADGSYSGILSVPGNVCRGKIVGSPFLQMDGQAVFKFAVRVLDEIARETLAQCDLRPEDIDWLIPHQANVRILEATAKRLGVGADKLIVTVDRHGNTSAASVPLALDLAVRDGRIRPGHKVMLQGVGGGFTWGAALVQM